MAGVTNVFYQIAGDVAKMAWTQIKGAMQAPPPEENPAREMPSFAAAQISLPRLLNLPNLPKLPGLPGFQSSTIIPSTEGSSLSAPTVAESYSAEMEDTSIACIPCTRRHVSTMATAGQELATAKDDYTIRKEIATIAAEALVMMEYDWSPDKLTRAREHDRQVILSIRPDVVRLLANLPMAPVQLLKAFGATDESRRFARSRKPSDKDQAQIARRMADMEGWVGYTESDMSGDSEALTVIREARHKIVDEGFTLEALDYAEEKLKHAAVILTPIPDRQTIDRAARDTDAIKEKFYAQVLGGMQAKRKSPVGPAFFAAVSPWNDGARWHMDRDTRLPAELRHFLDRRTDDPGQAASVASKVRLQPGLPFEGLMGATPDTVKYYQDLLAFNAANGMTVRERSLPADWSYGILNGAFSPDLSTIVVSAAANAEDSEALQTITHESTHSILHNQHCLPNPTPPDVYEAEYADTIEEREADITVLVVFTQLGLPLELSDGTTVPGRQWRINDAQLRAAVDPITYKRITWAAGVLVAAMKSGSASAAGCPIRQSA